MNLLAAEAALWAIPVASAIISLSSLVYVAVGVRRSSDAEHVDHLESRVADAERRLEVCERDRERLRDELKRMGEREVELMRLVVNLERKAGA